KKDGQRKVMQMADIKNQVNKIRNAIYGKEVRGSLADGLEAVNKETEDATEISVNVERRQDSVESQFDDLLSERSEDKKVDNEETIAARTNRETGENHKTLGNRLDKEYGQIKSKVDKNHDEVTSQLAETVQLIDDIDNKKVSKAE